MKKILFWILWALLCIVVWVVAAGIYKFNILEDDIYVQKESWNVVQYNDIIQVSSSILPISAVVNSIGWDYVEVENIVPAGVSPHWFDLSAKQMASISESEITFMIGLEHIDGFLEKAISEEKQVHLADSMELIKVEWHDHDNHSDEGEHEEESHDEHGHDESHHEDDEHDHEEHSEDHHDEDEHEEESHDDHDEHDHDRDPHVWLGKDNIITIANKIRDELSTLLPEQAVYFSENTESFIAEIEAIYTEFDESISEVI